MQQTCNIPLFPAFLLQYRGDEVAIAGRHATGLQAILQTIGKATGVQLTNFEIASNNFLHHELKNQLMTYVFSSLYSDLTIRDNKLPPCVAGLSMGLYAALYAAGSITRTEGALLVKQAYDNMQSLIKEKSCGMLSLIGLSEPDVQELISTHQLDCDIALYNSPHAFIIAGTHGALVRLEQAAMEEGAIHIRRLPVKTPYHSTHIKGIEDRKDEILSGITIQEAMVPVYSALQETAILSPSEIAQEIIKNLSSPVYWYQTLRMLQQTYPCHFSECGPGSSLQKMSRLMNLPSPVQGIARLIKKS